eukprot:TRINITY_DN9153_c0_g1_i1.p1 TRINITY_DN9153_c0_g1~~TRINITY_DN9153_c0_g1_i1.p1  ORF type:complete len:500 (+),score=104.22 TRINITY_DN9153_c0_g1_i1:160-1500(+)
MDVDLSITGHDLKKYICSEDEFDLGHVKFHKMRLEYKDTFLNPRQSLGEQIDNEGDEILVYLPEDAPSELSSPISNRLNKSVSRLKRDVDNLTKSIKTLENTESAELSEEAIRTIVTRLDYLEEKMEIRSQQFDYAMNELKGLGDAVKILMHGPGQLNAYGPKIPVSQCLETLSGHEGPVWALSSGGPGILISGSSDNTIKVWDMDSLSVRQTLSGHTSIVHSVESYNNGQMIVSGSDDKTIKVWDVEESRCLKTIEDDNIACVLRVARGNLFSGSFKCVKVWDMETMNNDHILGGHNHWVRAINCSNGMLFSGGHNIIKIWDLQNEYQCIQTLEKNCGSIYSILVTNNLLFAGSYDNTILIWDLRSFQCVHTLRGHSGAVYSMANFGNKIYSGSYDNTILAWDLNTCKPIHQYTGHGSSVEALLVSETHGLVSGSTDSTIRLWRP